MLGKLLGHPEDSRKYEIWDGFILPSCRLGLEFEFENVRNPMLPLEHWSTLWDRHEERSIRDHGSEYVFREPMFGLDAYQAIVALMNHAKESQWRASRRTGIHVHVDARDMSIPQLQGVCLLYAIYEPALYRWVGDDRDTNVFCLPWYRAEGGIRDSANVLRNAIQENSAESLRGITRTAVELVNRYAGMNLNSLLRHGSIEFRQLKTTLDISRVVNWINIVLALKLGAMNAPQCDGELLNMIGRDGPRRVGRTLMGKTFDLLDYSELEEEVMEIGIPVAHQLVHEGINPPPLTFTTPWPAGTNPGFSRFVDSSRNPPEALPERQFVPAGPQGHEQSAQGLWNELQPHETQQEVLARFRRRNEELRREMQRRVIPVSWTEEEQNHIVPPPVWPTLAPDEASDRDDEQDF